MHRIYANKRIADGNPVKASSRLSVKPPWALVEQ